MIGIRHLLLLLPLMLVGCANYNVQTDHDPTVDFSRYHTYFWKHLPDSGNALMDRRIVTAIDTQLLAKGWRKAPEAAAQTALAASVATREAQQMMTYHDNWGPAWQGWGRRGPVMSTTRVLTYQEGTLVLDLYDAQTKEAIWRGSAMHTVNKNPQKMTRIIEDGVREIFEKFPPSQIEGGGVR
jgi:hypothetical protein